MLIKFALFSAMFLLMVTVHNIVQDNVLGRRRALPDLFQARWDWVGMCLFPLLNQHLNTFFVGWAAPDRDPKLSIELREKAAWAGIGAYFGLFAVGVGLQYVVRTLHDSLPMVASVLAINFTIYSLFTAILNLFPIPPVDGYTVFGPYLSVKARAFLEKLNFGGGIFYAALWIVIGQRLVQPLVSIIFKRTWVY